MAKLSGVEKGVIIGGIILVAGVIGLTKYLKAPKATININKANGDGYATLGSKSADFTKITGVVIPSWNGYQLSAGGNGKYSLTRYGKVIESGTITEYDGGSSYVTINQMG